MRKENESLPHYIFQGEFLQDSPLGCLISALIIIIMVALVAGLGYLFYWVMGEGTESARIAVCIIYYIIINVTMWFCSYKWSLGKYAFPLSLTVTTLFFIFLAAVYLQA